jgi:hypothetical protein
MADEGLLWLDERFAESLNFCLMFVRGTSERAVLTAVGADPDEAVLMTRHQAEQADASFVHGYGPFVRVGRSGDWLFAWEEASWEGGRPEVLRRASAGGEAVTVLNTVASFAGFGYAADGEVVAKLVTIVPYAREGSAPDRFLPLIREAGLVFPPEPGAPRRPADLRAVLMIAEQAFGLSITAEDLDRPLAGARILPVLADLPPRPGPPNGGGWHVGDPVIDLLITHADEPTLRAAVAGQVRGVLQDSGLNQYGTLTRAVEEALSGSLRAATNEDPAGLVLRHIGRESYEANQDGFSRQRHLAPEDRRRRAARSDAAQALRRVLAWGPEAALASVVEYRRRWDSPHWREEFRRDLASTQVPAADLQEAERQLAARQRGGPSGRYRGSPGS